MLLAGEHSRRRGLPSHSSKDARPWLWSGFDLSNSVAGCVPCPRSPRLVRTTTARRHSDRSLYSHLLSPHHRATSPSTATCTARGRAGDAPAGQQLPSPSPKIGILLGSMMPVSVASHASLGNDRSADALATHSLERRWRRTRVPKADWPTTRFTQRNTTTTPRWSDATVSGTHASTTSHVGVSNTQSMRFLGAAAG